MKADRASRARDWTGRGVSTRDETEWFEMWTDRLELRANAPERFLDVDGEANHTLERLAGGNASVRLQRAMSSPLARWDA